MAIVGPVMFFNVAYLAYIFVFGLVFLIVSTLIRASMCPR